MEHTVDRLPKLLKEVKALSAKFKKKLTKAKDAKKIRENLGQTEAMQLREAIGSDIYARIGTEQVFITVLNDFYHFIDNLLES